MMANQMVTLEGVFFYPSTVGLPPKESPRPTLPDPNRLLLEHFIFSRLMQPTATATATGFPPRMLFPDLIWVLQFFSRCAGSGHWKWRRGEITRPPLKWDFMSRFFYFF